MLRLSRWILAASAMAAILFTFGGCGSGGGGSSTTTTTGLTRTLNVYVTDNFSDNYSQVLITLYKIEGTTDGQNYQTLYEDASGQTVDLTSLANAAQLLATVQVPTATFTQARVTLGSEITLVPRGGGASTMVPVDSTASNVTCSNSQCAVTLTANTTLTSSQLSNLVLDFNLASFELVGGHVRCSVQSVPGGQLLNKQGHGHLAGTVTNLTAGTGFTLQEPNGNTLNVSLTSTTVIASDNGQTPTLANGQAVVVEGTVDPTTTTVTAASVLVLTQGLPMRPQDAAGSVASVNASAGSFTLTVTRASHLIPSGGTITVQTDQNTVFHTGPRDSASFSNVAVGSQALASGTFDSSTQTLTAKLVLIRSSSQ